MSETSELRDRSAGYAAQRRRTMAENVAWLLERGDDEPPRYIGVIDGSLDWTDDIDKALRLARREDADKLAELVDDCWRVAEHMWPEPSPPAQMEQSQPAENMCRVCQRTLHHSKLSGLTFCPNCGTRPVEPSPTPAGGLTDACRKCGKSFSALSVRPFCDECSILGPKCPDCGTQTEATQTKSLGDKEWTHQWNCVNPECERLGAVGDSRPPAEPEKCPTCGSPDKKKCYGFCPDAWHGDGPIENGYVAQPGEPPRAIESHPSQPAGKEPVTDADFEDLVCLIATLDPKWYDADRDNVLEEFDPWHFLRELHKKLRIEQPAPAVGARELAKKIVEWQRMGEERSLELREHIIEGWIDTFARNFAARVTAAKDAEIAELKRKYKTDCIVEIAVENPNVAEYVRHWEGRAEAAEADLADLKTAK